MVGVHRKFNTHCYLIVWAWKFEFIPIPSMYGIFTYMYRNWPKRRYRFFGSWDVFLRVFFETRGFTPFPRGCFPSLAKSHVNHVLDRSKAPGPTLFFVVFYRKESLLNRACRWFDMFVGYKNSISIALLALWDLILGPQDSLFWTL